MKLRTIMIFPEFDNMEIIRNIRKRYDPLAELVAPHITIVFPFKSKMSNEELSQVLAKRLKGIKSFDIELSGISKQTDRFGNYLFLNLNKGIEETCSIHQHLYENEFKEFNVGIEYAPHMTIGNLPDVHSLNDAYTAIQPLDCVFHTTVNKISVEMIGDHDESIIIIEKYLD